MPNGTYGGVRGRKTKVGRKLLRFPPTRLYKNAGSLYKCFLCVVQIPAEICAYFKRDLLKPFCSLLNVEFYYPVKRLLLLVTYWY